MGSFSHSSSFIYVHKYKYIQTHGDCKKLPIIICTGIYNPNWALRHICNIELWKGCLLTEPLVMFSTCFQKCFNQHQDTSDNVDGVVGVQIEICQKFIACEK